MGVCDAVVELERPSISPFGDFEQPLFFQCVAVVHPGGTVLRVPIKLVAVTPRCFRPNPQFSPDRSFFFAFTDPVLIVNEFHPVSKLVGCEECLE